MLQIWKVAMEGKVNKNGTKEYRDSVWRYYSEDGLLTTVETYNDKGKLNSRKFMYFTNNKPMSETYEFFEGDYHHKSSFKFHVIEKLYYTNGQPLSLRHKINDEVVDIRCWDSKGNPRPIEYLNSIKSVSADK